MLRRGLLLVEEALLLDAAKVIKCLLHSAEEVAKALVAKALLQMPQGSALIQPRRHRL
jgi:hypothetical protein